ncbi:MAG: YaiI/YqxD family protein [Planctomycetota bacterium]|nr:YaiI/YqxD family protein [Planctomycetota bacterium]MDA1137225.1 YaiI/YqxD family protein [Planctomycetota bacterium]
MQLWVDADACPKVIKDILFRAAERVRVHLTLVSNQDLRVPVSKYITTIQVPGGPDVADKRIVDLIGSDDLVITADIPLADAVIKKGGLALDPRGELYTDDNVGQRLATRNLLSDLRTAGAITGGPPTISSKHRQAFANQLDRFLIRNRKK